MHGLQTFAFLKAAKVNQRRDSPYAPMSRMIKADITEPIAQQGNISGHVMAGCPICLLFPDSWLLLSSSKKKERRNKKGRRVFCGSRSLAVNWLWT